MNGTNGKRLGATETVKQRRIGLIIMLIITVIMIF
jgi:hypothetical protein